MLKQKSFYDNDRKGLVWTLESKLIKKYSGTLEKCLNKVVDETITFDYNEDKSSVNAFIPIDDDKVLRGTEKVAIDPSIILGINEAVKNFVNTSMTMEYKSTEFIPLDGYPIENLKEDIKKAIAEKRRFCVIDHFDSLQEFNKSQLEIYQATFDYLTDDYSNIAIAINKGSLEEVAELTKGKLVKTGWL